MLSNDANILKIKHEILYQVAKLAYAGQLEEKKEELPYELLPGPQAKYRCCVYKEREVVRQRIRLAEGKCPSETPKTGKDNVVQVIEAACADCPLSHYIVTDNCRKCMAKACQQACKFGAVSMGRDRAYIDPDKCKECGQCAKACPYNAIADLIRPCKKICPVGAITMDENGICEIDDSKCIKCGHCIHACPFGAIGSKTDIVDVIKAITSGKKVVAMVAPAIEGSFGADITMDSIRTACKKVGFSDMVEVALGGDMTAGAEAKEWLEANKEGKKMTTSCCPAFVNMIKKHYPELTDNISTTVSPMCAVSRMLKSKDKDTVTVFIGPCIAKKDERRNKDLEGNADYVLTVGEYRAMLRAKDVKIEAEANSSQQASVYGKRFGNGGGVAAAVVECMKELGEDPSKFTIEKCSGGAECKKALTLLKMDRLQADFVEGMACEGGCVGGPSHHRSSKNEMLVAKDRDKLLSEADDRKIYDNLKSYDMKEFSMHAESEVRNKMRFEGIKKVLDGHFINRYDITYTTEDNRTKVYEIISRNDNVSSLADLHNDRPDGVVIVATDIDGGKILINKEYRMSVGDYVYNFPAGLIDEGETAEVAAKRELKEETGLNLIRIDDKLYDSYSAIGFSNETNQVVIGKAEGTFSKSTSTMEEITASWYTKEEVKELLKNCRFAARTQAFCYMWAKGGC